MERKEKSVERGGEGRGGIIVEKLKKGIIVVGKKRGGGGPSTPSPTWRLELPSQQNCSNSYVQEFLNFPTTSTISARKLCANLWEIQPYKHHQASFHNMNKNNPATRLRCRRRCRRFAKQVAEPPDYPSDQLESASSLKRHVAASLVEHHKSVQRNGCTLLPESRASYCSSVNVAPCNHVTTPISSLDVKGMIGESSHSLKTSTELLKILNRIWSVEEQHASNVSVVKGLKMELGHSQARLKELLREKQMNRHEMQNLMKQMTADKLFRKKKEHDRTKAAIQSVNKELEDERRLRKHSESLHRKLARDLAEVKSSFSGCLRNLERERKARILLENLCDEFAKGIKDYEQEIHYLMRSSENSQDKESNSLDKLILHISEAWLDERMQMKTTQSSDDLGERNSIVDKLGLDIETFLHSKRSVDFKKLGCSLPELKEIYPCQHSLDSFPPKESTSAPRNIAQEDSVDTDFYEPKLSAGEELHKLSTRLMQCNNDPEAHLEKKGKQVQSKEINKNMSYIDNENRSLGKKSSEIVGDDTGLLNEEAKQGPPEIGRPWSDNLVGNSSLSSEGDKVYPENICRVDSCVQSAVTTDGSPVKLWKLKLAVSDFDMSESSTKLPKGVKENTLMAKLLEARLEAQKSRDRANKSTS